MVNLRFENGQFIAVFAFNRDIIATVKNAGFRWDPGRKVWWTGDVDKALNLAQDIDLPEEQVKLLTGEKTALAGEAQRLYELSGATESDFDAPTPVGLDLYPHQRAFCEFASIRGNRGILCADEMGTGKTPSSIAFSNSFPDIRKVLIITTLSTKVNWLREWETWCTKGLRVALATSRGLPTDADVIIANYEIMPKWRDCPKGLEGDPSAINMHLDRDWDLIICDECHKIKNPQSKRTRSILGGGPWRRGLRAKYRLFLTGTPVLNRPIELWPIVRALDPQNLGRSWRRFVETYCAGFQSRYGWDTSGASNLEDLQRKLRSSIMIRRLKTQVLEHLPPIQRQLITLPANGNKALLDAELLAYNQRQEVLDLLKTAKRTIADPDEYHRTVDRLTDESNAHFTELAKIRKQVGLKKVPAIVKHIEDTLEQEAKVVVFLYHRDVVAEVKRAYPDACVVTGEVTGNRRQEEVDRFVNGDSRVFLGNYKACAEGLTLHAGGSARVCILGEMDWVPGTIEQAIARVHRIGTEAENVLVHYVVFDGSLDARMAQRVEDKTEIIEATLN